MGRFSVAALCQITYAAPLRRLHPGCRRAHARMGLLGPFHGGLWSAPRRRPCRSRHHPAPVHSGYRGLGLPA
eukprot:5469086-Lingulodinium_polyedra.AAC.1